MAGHAETRVPTRVATRWTEKLRSESRELMRERREVLFPSGKETVKEVLSIKKPRIQSVDKG